MSLFLAFDKESNTCCGVEIDWTGRIPDRLQVRALRKLHVFLDMLFVAHNVGSDLVSMLRTVISNASDIRSRHLFL